MRIALDIETRSRVDIKAGVYRYVECPDFQILMMGWTDGAGRAQLVTGHAECVALFRRWWVDPDVEFIAHNAEFERVCFSAALGEQLPPERWIDTMAIAAERGLPQGLDRLAQVVGAEQKDSAGKLLINRFCRPNRAGGWTTPEDRPVDWANFCAYCAQDVDTMVDVLRRMGGWPTEFERHLWNVDQRINARGVAIDLDLAAAAVEAAEENRMVQELEISAITGVANPGSVQQLGEWLGMPSLAKDAVETELARTDISPEKRRVLELRQDLALTAAKKFQTAIDGTCADGRLRGQFRFFGAHTGRWSGRGVQLHNLPRAALEPAEESAAIADLLMGFGATSSALKALVRPLLVGPFTVVDYSAIEARVLAWLSGEQWVLDAFAAGRDIYVETAERMSTPGRTYDRFDGKVAVLALGFAGGKMALRAMGGEGTNDEVQYQIDTWRAANPHTVQFWADLDQATRLAYARPKVSVPVGRLRVSYRDGTMQIHLPSGRSTRYHGIGWASRDDDLTVPGYRPTDEPGNQWSSMVYRDPTRGWYIRTYGGRLAENVTQAVARDLLAEALVALEVEGYPVVGHVHDEVLVEGEHPLDAITAVMTRNPLWASGLPLAGEGFVTQRYRKG